jgi:transglutaminase-like putative cysteine protease
MSAKKKVTKRNIIIGIIFGLLFACIPLYIFLFNPQRTFNIIETYRITSEYGAETFLRVTLPMSGAYQEITNLQVDGAIDYEIDYFDGWRELTARVPTSGYEVTITISYTARLFRNAGTWDGEVRPEYILPQQFVDSDNESIIELAEQLHGANDFQTARNIFNHTNRTITTRTGTFASEGDDPTQPYASEILLNPVGVCYDYAILMTALLRAQGIPARMISGLSLNIPLDRGGDWSHPGVAHSWVEFYADGAWHFADPTWGRRYFNRNGTVHLSFGTFEAYIRSDFQRNRFAAIEDDGFIIRGAMSAPLSFTVFSTDENTIVTPGADVNFSWFR